jgi:hypothetical protein
MPRRLGYIRGMQKFPWMAALSVTGLCFLSVLYGAIAVHMNWWPSDTVRDAKFALEALSSVANEEFDKQWPAGMEAVAPAAASAPRGRLLDVNANLPDDLIFVDGGAQQLRSHCPDNGCIAWVTNRAGDILHVWDVGPELIWEDLKSVDGFSRPENIYSVGAWPYPNGDLVVVYQGRNTYPYGIGIARFDRDSKLLWKKENYSHHWLSVDTDGLIYTSAFQARPAPVPIDDSWLQFNCRGNMLYEDVIVVLDAAGNEVERISLLDQLIASGYSGLVFQDKHSDYPLPIDYEECDPTHLNDVRVVSAAAAAGSDLLATGDLFVSMRSLNTIALLDRTTRRVKWLSTGRFVLQHSPRYRGNDQLLVFDNLGGSASQGGSRLVNLDMRSGVATAVYPRPTSTTDDFLSATAGHIDLSDDGRRALVSLTRQARVVEVDLQSGTPVWEYTNSHDVSGLARDADGAAIASGLFATQTINYFNEAAFEFNGGIPGGRE